MISSQMFLWYHIKARAVGTIAVNPKEPSIDRFLLISLIEPSTDEKGLAV